MLSAAENPVNMAEAIKFLKQQSKLDRLKNLKPGVLEKLYNSGLIDWIERTYLFMDEYADDTTNTLIELKQKGFLNDWLMMHVNYQGIGWEKYVLRAFSILVSLGFGDDQDECDTVLSHKNPLQMAKAYKELFENNLLDDRNKQLICHAENPVELASALKRLNDNGLLNEENKNSIAPAASPSSAADILILLGGKNIAHGLKELIFKILTVSMSFIRTRERGWNSLMIMTFLTRMCRAGFRRKRTR
jgi:hypothetical protein